ncbi:hypothetical protein OH805_38305 [Streptomyces sp. NBC_00879]|uniref:hypothetical protein n=1 Tax=Streptomyces sp. NBC_00879 TaxID=2975855 RepID=UPI003870AD1B|nr:hypothetical protein OH805_38305 [Streptomyces sp. NBC_00879]
MLPSHGEPGWYRLPEADRAAYFQEWFTPGNRAVPAELRDVESRIADFWGKAGDHAEVVRHLLLISADRALARFDALFSEADERRDFAACQDLVDVLADPDRIAYTDPAVQQRLADRAGYVRARTYWAADYARSAQFLKPKNLMRDTRLLLNGRHRVWHLYAPGGAGKTMQLRWLVARHCVPAKRDVLCARIDFDIISAHAVGRHPWLLLLEISEQFGRRLPGQPFERLEAYAAYRVLLTNRPSGPARVAARSITSLDSRKVEEELLTAFAERLNRAYPNKPAVLVIDTLEELLLHEAAEAKHLVRLLGRLMELCPGLRLVLCGRYDLRERIPHALDVFGKHIKHSSIEPFGMAQTREYLITVRGIKNRKLVRVAGKKSEGKPFHLALFADVIERDPQITAEALDACDEPQVRFLIDRVVHHISDPAVRWLLRYGVIPRRLRFQDVTTVMRNWLSQGITGTGDADNPLSDAHHLKGNPKVFPIAATAPTDAELEQAWRRLLDYASSSSWVSRHPGDDSVVVFHSDVLAPMRQLISDHPVSRHLHQAFVEHFEELARSDPNQWVSCTKEAIYHRFQAGDDQAASSWRAAVREMWAQRRMDAVQELCKEVLGNEYVNGEELRLRMDGQPLISREALVDAHLGIAAALAVTTAETEAADPADPRWNEIERQLAFMGELRRGSPEPIPEHSLESVLRAKALMSRDRHEEAAQAIRGALATEQSVPLREQLQITLARIQTAQNDPAAESTYRAALTTARARKSGESESVIELELAHHLKRQGRIAPALELLDSVMAKTAPSTPGRGQPSRPTSEPSQHASLRHRALVLQVHCQLQEYLPTEVMQSLGRLDPDRASEAHRFETNLLLAHAQHQLGRSRDALATLDSGDALFTGVLGPAQYRWLARSMMKRGVIEGELLAVDRAESSFERAASLYSDLGFPQGHPKCLLLYARFLIRHLGDLHRAARALDQLRAADVRGQRSVQQALLWHELHRQGYPVPDPALLEVPQLSLQDLLSGGVAAVIADPGRASALRHALAMVQPPQARLESLSGLAGCPTPSTTAQDSSELELLRPLFSPIAHLTPSSLDHQVQLTRLAEFERVCGRREDAARLIEQSHHRLCNAADDDPLPVWRLARSQMRLSGRPERQASQALHERTPSDMHLLSAVARWLLASAHTDERKESLLLAAAEALSQVHHCSVWETDIRRSLAAALDDEPTRQTAHRMAAHLGHHDRDPGTPTTAPARSARERVIAIASPSAPRSQAAPDPERMANALLEDWKGTTADQSSRLRIHSRGSAPVTWLQFQSDDVSAHAYPWELSTHANGLTPYRSLPDAAHAADVRALQAAINTRAGYNLVADGILGTVTRAALAAAAGAAWESLASTKKRTLLSLGMSVGMSAAMWGLIREARKQARARFGERAVVLLHDGSSRYLLPTRMTHHSPLAAIYEARGCDVRQLLTPTALPPTRKGPPAIVHVSAPLRLKSGSTPYFDLAPVDLNHIDRLESKASGSDLDPGRLVEWLAEFEPGTQPLVVLDPPRPSSSADIPLQLILRNLFAARLFASGVAPAVVGIGLVRTASHQTEVLAASVVQDIPLLDLYEALRREGAVTADLSRSLLKRKDADWGDDALESASASLFAAPTALGLPDTEQEQQS